MKATDEILIFTHIFLTSVVLVLNEMVLVLVIDSLVATEHEHEITNKSGEAGPEMWVKMRMKSVVSVGRIA